MGTVLRRGLTAPVTRISPRATAHPSDEAPAGWALAGRVPERSRAERDGYVVGALVKAMGDECVDVVGYGHHGCDGLVEVQLGHWLAIAGVDSKLRGLVGEEPDNVGTVRQCNRRDRLGPC